MHLLYNSVMEKIFNELNNWLEGLKNSSLPKYEDLPDVSLYMDQIVSYVDTILTPYSRDEQKLITSFMVNNYVKAKIIDAPTLKRYNKNQLAYLISICLLKQITSMSNMAVLLNKINIKGEQNEFYDFFINMHNNLKNSIHDKAVSSLNKIQNGEKPLTRGRKKHVEETLPNEDKIRKNLIELSLKLMIESELNKMVAERILYELGQSVYKNDKLFETKLKEEIYENRKSKIETKRIKKVNSENQN